MHKLFGENACVANGSRKRLHPLYVRKLVQSRSRRALNERDRFRSSGLKRVCATCFGSFVGEMAQGSTRGLLSNLTLKKFRSPIQLRFHAKARFARSTSRATTKRIVPQSTLPATSIPHIICTQQARKDCEITSQTEQSLAATTLKRQQSQRLSSGAIGCPCSIFICRTMRLHWSSNRDSRCACSTAIGAWRCFAAVRCP